jgi:hypothetical protein
LKIIRGYDEYYEVWGGEDVDLLRRLRYLGLEAQSLGSDSFYMHQWHPKFEDVPQGAASQRIRDNHAHLKRSHGILRNGPDWGVA